MFIVYDTNNSGGSWWLKTADWQALEDAGWIVHWIHDVDDPSHTHAEDDSYDRKWGSHKHKYSDQLVPAVWNGEDFLGGASQSAAKEVANEDEALAAIGEFERITGQRVSDQGCNCCGPPHSFQLYGDDGEYRYLNIEPAEPIRYKMGWS